MIKNYFKIALRNLRKNKGYSIINIGGLAVGMAVAILIGLWIYDEVSFDKYHKNYGSIGQIWVAGKDPEKSEMLTFQAVAYPAGMALKNNYGHYFKNVSMAWWIGDYTLSTNDNKFTRKGEFIDAGGPEMLTLNMLRGSYSCLADPHSIILSEKTAKAIFGKEDPMNKLLKIDNRIDVKVTGVYEDIPKNNRFSEVQFFSPWDLWVSSNDWIKDNVDRWGNQSFNVYVQLQPHVTAEQANQALQRFFHDNAPPEFIKEADKYKAFVEVVPMSTWHLYSEFRDGKPATGRITFVWLFGIVGVFVLLLACINFMNLSTARSEKRAKEVGIRKAIGSLKGQLIRQFLGESFLVVLLSFLLSIVLVLVSLGWFNELADKDISLPLANPLFWTAIIIFIGLTTVLAGLYPAFYLSSFQPIKILKGTLKAGRFASIPRKVLVVVQFTVSIALIIGTIVVYQQIQHARNRPIGYDREGLISVSLNDPNYNGKQDVMRTELLNTGVVANTALASSPLTQVWNNSGSYTWTGRDPNKDNSFAICNVTHEFGKTVNWQLIKGRDFSKDFATDSAALIINETAAKYMNLKNPIGEIITHHNYPGKSWRIIGVVKDIIMESPYEPVKQTFFFLDYNYNAASLIDIRIKPGVSATTAIGKIEAIFKKLVPSASFDYKFVDAQYGAKFSEEVRIGKLATCFAILAIFISCLGLFGLASFIAEQRTKEIGIRKIIGASVFDLWRMLSKDFVILVIISCLVAIPISYYYMHGWLQKYQYKTSMPVWVFAAAIGGALLITLLTVSFQAIKAAIANPVKSLRAE
jgi:putative ABC transport system permease protein